MATTTNYGWTTPDDTDLVKDGAAAIRTLGSSVDTTTKALNPSTTEGDIEYRSATANTNTRIAIGTAGQVLQVNSGATAPEWATLPASALALTGSSTFTSTSSVNIDNCFSSAYDNYIIVFNADCSNTGDNVNIRYRVGGSTNTSSNFHTQELDVDGTNVSATRNAATATEGRIARLHTGFTQAHGYIQSPFIASPTWCWSTNSFNTESLLGNKTYWNTFIATTSFDGLNIFAGTGTMTGTVKIYGLVNS